MAADSLFVFHPFRLDLANEQLWRGAERLALRPKPFAILRYLVEHPGRLITKEELTKAVWPDTYVGESSLKGYIRDLRGVLGDQSETPQFIETVARRGYRFVAAVYKEERDAKVPSAVAPMEPRGVAETLSSRTVVGREREVAQLRERFDKALRGERQVVFITGEPGIGKTTLIDVFLQQVVVTGRTWVGRGQCVEHYGAGEAYLPVLEAVSRSCRQPGAERVLAVLRRYAPTWLVQMPALIADTEYEALQRKVQGATRERMLREMAEALETLAATTPVVLVIEDLQWSDHSTLDLLSYVAQRREPAQLLLIGTYRPTDVILSGHPVKAIKQELQGRRLCEELALSFLPQDAVNQYLSARFPHHQFPGDLSQFLYRSTEGNPLFLVNMVEDLLARNLIVSVDGHWQLSAAFTHAALDVPENVRQLIERQLERLTQEEQHLLESASVAGAEFLGIVAASGGPESGAQAERTYEDFVRRGHFLRSDGIALLPDQTVTGRYSFLHSLYQTVIYQRTPAPRRLSLHRRIGEQIERTAGSRTRELATELAMHFERGQAAHKAVHYLHQAAENAMRRAAPQEATELLQKGLTLLAACPDTDERRQCELTLQLLLATALTTTKGYAAPEVEHAITRARSMYDSLEQTSHLVPVLSGLSRFHLVRAEYEQARILGERLLELGQHTQDALLLLEAQIWLGMIALNCGASLDAGRHLEHGVALYNPPPPSEATVFQGQDLGVSSLSLFAIALWRLGQSDQARQRSMEALTLAHALGHPFSRAFALHHAVLLSLLYYDNQEALQRVNELLELTHVHGFSMLQASAAIFQGLLRVRQGTRDEGIRQIRQGLAAYRATGAEIATTCWLGFLAEGLTENRQVEEGLAVIGEALAISEKTGEQAWDAELYRLRGTLLLKQVDDI